jgi:hypothetical protein
MTTAIMMLSTSSHAMSPVDSNANDTDVMYEIDSNADDDSIAPEKPAESAEAELSMQSFSS